MRINFKIFITLVIVAITASAIAGGNDLFEAKTATEGLKQSTIKILSNVTQAERKVIKTATGAERSGLKAYQRCPEKSQKSLKALKKAARNLNRYDYALSNLSNASVEIDALAGFAASVNADIVALINSNRVCE